VRALTDGEQAKLSALAESFDALQARSEGNAEGDPAIAGDEAGCD